MQQEKFTYLIGEKQYLQRPLVLGQIQQLMGLLKGVGVPAGLDPVGITLLLGDRLPRALAIVLIEHSELCTKTCPDSNGNSELGRYLRERDLDALARDLAFTIDPETTIRVIEDFFDCNPIVSLFEKLSGMMERLNANIAAAKTSSTPSASS